MTFSEAGKKGGVNRARRAREAYEAAPSYCAYCTKPIPYRQRGNKFCNRACSASKTNKLRKKDRKCLNCDKSVQASYCSSRCQTALRQAKSLEKWRGDGVIATQNIPVAIKAYLLQKYGERCSLCGWSERHPVTGRVPIELDHTDGNSQNNNEANLRLLCPNCHSLTPTFRNLNKGNGRSFRRKTVRG